MNAVAAAPTGDGSEAGQRRIAAPRLARLDLRLDDGHRIGVALAGRGMPLVVVHGFTAEGFLYAQTLSRLVSMGFKVVAIDTAGHGGTAGLPDGGANMKQYAELLRRIIDHLGIRRAVLAGHSMGGRLVTELAARHPERAIAVLLIDAIVGDAWDRRVQLFRFSPALLALTGLALVLDTASTVPLVRDPVQARKLGRLAGPTVLNHVRRPWRLIGPGVSILRSGSTRWMLERLADEEIPVAVLHGERDVPVPIRTGRDAARRARGELITVRGASHSWLLKDPETLPAIVRHLLHRSLGDAYEQALVDAGLDPQAATIDDIEAALYEPGALAIELSPALEFEPTMVPRRPPRYTWSIERPA